ncbi:MAG: hypothetical protein ACAH80_07400 [Alphaproteobacteria bacterium]
MMFEEFLEKRRKKREQKERREAAYEAIKSGNEENVKTALDAVREDGIDKGWCLKLAIERQDLTVFKAVMAFVDDPNQQISYDIYNSSERQNYTYTYSPLEYALSVKSTHDISLWLAGEPRTDIKGGMLDSARKNGMQDVGMVLARRIAEIHRQAAAQLDREAGVAEEEPTLAAAIVENPAAAADDNNGESWALMSKTSVAHVTSSLAIGRKLTEIFNFESRERVQITENLKTGAESIGKPERFDDLAEGAVTRAEEMLKQLNGKSFRL